MHQRRIFHIDGTSPIDHQTKNQFILCLRAQNNTSAHPFSHLKREDSSNSQFNFKIVCVSEKHYTYLQCIGYTYISPALFDIWNLFCKTVRCWEQNEQQNSNYRAKRRNRRLRKSRSKLIESENWENLNKEKQFRFLIIDSCIFVISAIIYFICLQYTFTNQISFF